MVFAHTTGGCTSTAAHTVRGPYSRKPRSRDPPSGCYGSGSSFAIPALATGGLVTLDPRPAPPRTWCIPPPPRWPQPRLAPTMRFAGTSHPLQSPTLSRGRSGTGSGGRADPQLEGPLTAEVIPGPRTPLAVGEPSGIAPAFPRCRPGNPIPPKNWCPFSHPGSLPFRPALSPPLPAPAPTPAAAVPAPIPASSSAASTSALACRNVS